MMKRIDRGNESVYLKHTLATWDLIGSPDYPPTREELKARILRALHRSHSPQGYQNQMAAIIESGDRRGLLRRITCPSLVIHGQADALVPVQAGQDIANNIKHCKLEIIAGMGHDLPKELMPRFSKLILDIATSPPS